MSAGRILVIDDDPQIRRAMRATLTARGYQVGDARTGEEGLEEFRAEHLRSRAAGYEHARNGRDRNVPADSGRFRELPSSC